MEKLQQKGFMDGVTRGQQEAGKSNKGQQAGDRRDESSYEEEILARGARTQEEAKQDDEAEEKERLEAEAIKKMREEERERNKFTCQTCGKRKNAKDLALSFQSGGTCRDCAAVS